jgi:hypothetical protein
MFTRLEYIQLARHFVKEVLEIYEGWNGKASVPLKVQELMMVLQVELSNQHKWLQVFCESNITE